MRSNLSAQGYQYILASVFNTVYAVNAETTINSKYGIIANDINMDTIPGLNYLGVGIGGTTTESNGVIDLGLRHRDSSKIDLFAPVPFVIRDIDNDLSDVERENYRMRVETTVQGIPKVMYFLLNIETDIHAATASLDIIAVDSSGTKTPYEYSPNESINTSDGSRLFSSTKDVYVLLTSSQVDDLKASISLLYPDADPEQISEIGIYSGEDVTLDDGNKEVKLAQLIMSSSTICKVSSVGNTLNINTSFSIAGA